MEKKIEVISSRIFARAKYFECLLQRRDEVLKAMFEKDLCTIWKVLDECKVPCKDRWGMVKFIMEKAEDHDGPQWW